MKSTRRLRILQISHDYAGPFRGVCHQYACAFAGHEVTTLYICGHRNDDVIAQTGGDQVLFFERPSRAMRGIKLRTLFKVAKLFRGQTFDVVVAHRYKPIYLAGVMSYFFRIPVLLAVAHEHRVFKRLSRRRFITFWRRSIICVGVSRSVSLDIEHDCGPLASRGRLITLPHALDVGAASNIYSRRESRQALGVGQGAFCFGTVGRLVDKKEQGVLLAAFRQFLDTCGDVDVVLLIIGAGPEEQRLKRYAQQHAMADRVVFAGHVDDAYRYMSALDVFVLPSGVAEAFGIVLLEAMLASLPIISSDAPGPAEVVGSAALLFRTGDANDLADRLRAVHEMTAAERHRLARAGHDRLCEEYTMDAFRQRVWAIPGIRKMASALD